MDIEIKRTALSHKHEVLEVYRGASTIIGGLIRHEREVNREYVDELLANAMENGLSLVAQLKDSVVGEIHAYTPNIYAFQHILTDLTIAVEPAHRGKGVGRKLFLKFLEITEKEMPHIERIELFTRENNERNVKFYESPGFTNEGRQHHKIYQGNGKYETPIHMACFRPFM